MDFVNSFWRDWRGSGKSEDRLENAEWLRHFIAKWNLPGLEPADPGNIDRLRNLRELIGRMTGAITAGEPMRADQIDALNQIMSKGPVVYRIAAHEDGYKMSSVPLSNGTDQLMASIAASFAEWIGKGDHSRVRICENTDCLWVFYDDTKNRSKRYCDDRMCGNLLKVRRYRAKGKAHSKTRSEAQSNTTEPHSTR